MGAARDGERKSRKDVVCAATSLITRAFLAYGVFVASKRLLVRDSGSPTQKVKGFAALGDGHKLNKENRADLEAGKKILLTKRDANAGGGRGTCVCDIAAPPSMVWKTILDFDRYKGRLAQCKYSTVYGRKKNLVKRSEVIKVHMKLDGIIKDFNCYYEHIYRPDRSELTWTLDPEKTSDFLDVQGQWYVEKHPTKPEHSRVWYSADVLLPAWLPRMVVVQLCKTGGAKALTFVKRDAEEAFSSASKGGFGSRLFRGGAVLRGGATRKGLGSRLAPPRSIRRLKN